MKKFLRCILTIIIIANCIVIFNFSAQKSEKSSETSGKVIEKIVESNPKTKNLSQKEKEKKKEELVFPVRKTAHFSIYMSLGIWIYLLASTFEINNKKKVIISVALAFMYAMTDELHQIFVSGRSGEFKDVCIDTTGALTGVIVVLLISTCIKKIKGKNKTRIISKWLVK